MASRVFALLIGIDNYKSGRIWNLEACADDARRMRQWLLHDLRVPSTNVALLVNREATRQRIEDAFMNHLINNPAISQGDALLVYFAGHGSSMPAPRDWCEGRPSHVHVLCPHDHDTNGSGDRVAGISDRSLCSMLGELSAAKGDNITLILDSSFASLQLAENQRDRHGIRCTPTEKARKEDLFNGLWKGAIGKRFSGEHELYQDDCHTHTLLAACRLDELATEWKEGGRFTRQFLAMTKKTPIHQLTYFEISQRLNPVGHSPQHPVCLGRHKDRVLFNGIPFVTDNAFIPVERDKDGLRLHMGALHGVVEGTEFSVHSHNRCGSLNLSLDSFRVYQVHSTWSLARRKRVGRGGERGSWARITRWNTRTPFRVHAQRIFSYIFRRLLCREEPDGLQGIVEVKNSTLADIADEMHSRAITVPSLSQPAPPRLPVLEIENPQNPFRDHLRLELYLINPRSQRQVGQNLLFNSRADLVRTLTNSYIVILRNDTDRDLWPYLAHMDCNGADTHFLYHPSPTSAPTLPKHGSLEIRLALPQLDTGFLKLFVSTCYTSLGTLEQSSNSIQPDSLFSQPCQIGRDAQEWDTAFVILNFSDAR